MILNSCEVEIQTKNLASVLAYKIYYGLNLPTRKGIAASKDVDVRLGHSGLLIDELVSL